MSERARANTIEREQHSAVLSLLREARALVYRDAESFGQAATILEHVGQLVGGRVHDGLNAYKAEICKLGRTAPPIQCERIDELFETVRQARNDSVHSGDYIRHHAIRLVELLLVLEEGLAMSARIAEDLMVRDPLIAEPWQNIATVRRAMLTNSFSYLPTRDRGGQWKLISDASLVRYLRDPANSRRDDRNRCLGMTVQEAIDEGKIELVTCSCLSPSEGLSGLVSHVNETPVLILNEKKQLLGILTAFDLL